MDHEETVRRYARAVADLDLAAAAALRHPAWTATLPQAGERVSTGEGLAAAMGASEGPPGGGPAPDPVARPAGRLERVAGAGEAWTIERLVRGRDGRERFVVSLVELQDGLVRRERVYLAERVPRQGRPPGGELDHGSLREDDPLRDRMG